MGTILVDRYVITPNTNLKLLNRPTALRICLNNPNDREKFCGVDMSRPVAGIPILPYYHEGAGICWEYDYSDARTKRLFGETVDRCREMYGHNPNMIANEGFGIGQWGQGTIWQLNVYRNTKNKQICSFNDQKWYMETLRNAFPDKPLMCGYLVEPQHDIGSVGIGLDVTPNTYDDIFLHPGTSVLRNQIFEYSCEDAFHGAEVSNAVQEFYVKNTQKFIEDFKKDGRELAYMARFWYKPKNEIEKANLQQIYDFVQGVKK